MLTLVQLYNLGLVEQIDIFSGLSLPSDSPFDRTLIINSIIEHCGLNYPIYADPNVMRSAINIWSAKNQYTFEHLAKILKANYSPIENKDYTEETNTLRDRAMTDNTTGSNAKTESANNRFEEGNNQRTNEEHSGVDTTEDTTSAYNSSTYEPDNKSSLTHGEHIVGGVSGEHNSITNGTKNTNVNLTNNKDVDEAESIKVTSHQHGNVGVTSNVALQLEEYSLMKDYNPYTFIAGLFENELTLFVY